MEMRDRFERELRNGTGNIPMKDYCVRKAQDLVLEKHDKLLVIYKEDREMLEMLVEDYLFKYWRRRHHLQPNHRWLGIEGELNSDWMSIHWKGVPGTGY
jgi:hypothetical protein